MATQPVEVKRAPAVANAPPEAWRSFRTEMDRLFDRFAGGFGFPALRQMFDVGPAWRSETSLAMSVPAMDFTEDDQAYRLTAELPGLSEKDIEVTVSGDTLTLKGEKKEEKEEKNKNYYLSERSYGAFQRAITLPDAIDRDRIAAEFSKGVLTVTLPKTQEAQKQQKKIEVKAA
jgi:HSP20 family protein